MTWKKRIISITLCLCALLCAASVRAEAAGAHSHPICGASHTDVGDHTGTCNDVTWTAWDGTTTINNDFFGNSTEKYLYLSQDVTPGNYIIVPGGKTLYLCLNGYSIKSKAYYAIYVSGTLVLCDCNSSGQGKGVISHGKEDGSICGEDGIYVVDNAIFTMYGGTISNNDGSGVLVSGGTFTMYGGEISHNTHTTSSAGGGGVWVKNYKSSEGKIPGNFAMYGGTICNNEIQSSVFGGGGVGMDSDGSFYMENGTITGNKCNNSGGGLDIRCKTITIKGNSTISNNTCDGEGGGIFAISSGESSITNCTISGNSATGTNSLGGGLTFQNSTFTLKECAITDNKTAGQGGAICLMTSDANLTLSNGLKFSGNAQGCTADENGKLTGGTANDVYLYTSSAYLRLASDFSKTSAAPIVVTMFSEPTNKTVKIAEGSAGAAKATDFTYGNGSSIGIIAKTKADGTTVELLACKHNYSTQKDAANHWQECSICKDKKDEAAHSGGKASCTEKAVCQVCHQPYGGYAAHDYDMTKWVKADENEHGRECTKCHAIGEKTAHSYAEVVDDAYKVSAATCTDKAVYYKSCVCGARGTDTFEFGEKLAHTYDKEVATETYLKSAATCTDRAVYYKSCVCGARGTDTFEFGEKNPNNHTGTLGSWQTNTDEHWKEYSCCQAQSDKAAHTWNEGTVTTLATCTTPGEKTYTCGTCNAKKTEVIPASGHDLVHHEAKAATCAAVGWDAYDTCTRCDYTTYVEKSALGHDFTVPKYDEIQHWYKCANCTATTEPVAHTDFTAWKSDRSGHWHECSTCGYKTAVNAHTPDRDKATETEAKVCKDCDWVIAPATHPVHTWVFVPETPATCNATGEREHYKCTCGRTSFKNDDAYDINADAEVLTIKKNSANHTGAPDSKWLSDSANHWQEYTCCHAKANEAAHSGGAATCTAQAVCEVCGKAYGPLAAHAWQPATCTAPKTCSVCHTTEGTALGHAWQPATCTEPKTCSVCDATEGAALGHAWQPATCTAPKTCSVCHTTEGAALGHDWGAWKVTTPATKDAPGVETRTCAHNSAHTETRSIPKLSTTVYTVSEDTKIAQIEAKVDGLDKILELDENKALVNDGKSVGVSLTVKNTASSGVSEKIKEKLAGSNLVGLRLELTVEKTVTENGAVVERETIPDTVELLKTTITLPAELQGKSGYVVYRLHDGNVHVLTEKPNENGEFITVSADKTQITICARLYSEYVIAYQTSGSSGGGYHPVNPTPVKATSANTGDAGVLLYGVTAALSLTGTAWLGAKSRKH